MLKYFYFLFVLFTVSCTNTLYIVRHAEKSETPKNNPELTQAGNKRAEYLKNILKNSRIQTFYSTNTNRTFNTAKPLATLNNKKINIYKPDSIRYVLKDIFKSKKNTLLIGHSNSIINTLDTLQLKHKIIKVAETEYDNLFIVKFKKYNSKKKNPFIATLKETKYNLPIK